MARTRARKNVVRRREESSSETSILVNNIRISVNFGACQRNHAIKPGEYVFDGCQEFMASRAEGVDSAMTCDACGCNRNFHRVEVEIDII